MNENEATVSGLSIDGSAPVETLGSTGSAIRNDRWKQIVPIVFVDDVDATRSGCQHTEDAETEESTKYQETTERDAGTRVLPKIVRTDQQTDGRENSRW